MFLLFGISVSIKHNQTPMPLLSYGDKVIFGSVNLINSLPLGADCSRIKLPEPPRGIYP
jgi:hypothetical protein